MLSSPRKHPTTRLTNSPTPGPRPHAIPPLFWRLLTLGWAVAIYRLSTETFGSSFSGWLLAQALSLLHISVSPTTFSVLHTLLRKGAHLTEYAVFGLLIYRSFWNAPKVEWRTRTALWAVLVAGLYSLTDEFHQSFEPGRTASLVDCGIDSVGAALGMLGLYGSERLFQVKAARAATKNEGAGMK